MAILSAEKSRLSSVKGSRLTRLSIMVVYNSNRDVQLYIKGLFGLNCYLDWWAHAVTIVYVARSLKTPVIRRAQRIKASCESTWQINICLKPYAIVCIHFARYLCTLQLLEEVHDKVIQATTTLSSCELCMHTVRPFVLRSWLYSLENGLVTVSHAVVALLKWSMSKGTNGNGDFMCARPMACPMHETHIKRMWKSATTNHTKN